MEVIMKGVNDTIEEIDTLDKEKNQCKKFLKEMKFFKEIWNTMKDLRVIESREIS